MQQVKQIMLIKNYNDKIKKNIGGNWTAGDPSQSRESIEMR